MKKWLNSAMEKSSCKSGLHFSALPHVLTPWSFETDFSPVVLHPPKAGEIEVMHNLTHVPIQLFAFFWYGIYFSRGLLLFHSRKIIFGGSKISFGMKK